MHCTAQLIHIFHFAAEAVPTFVAELSPESRLQFIQQLRVRFVASQQKAFPQRVNVFLRPFQLTL